MGNKKDKNSRVRTRHFVDYGEVQHLIELWERVVQNYSQVLDLENDQIEKLAYAEERLSYWLKVQKKQP